MWDYIAEAHRLDLHTQAEQRRLVRLARTGCPDAFTGPIKTLRRQIATWFEAHTTQTTDPTLNRQEIQPCVDAQ